MHLERPKLHTILAFLSAVGLIEIPFSHLNIVSPESVIVIFPKFEQVGFLCQYESKLADMMTNSADTDKELAGQDQYYLLKELYSSF